MIVEYIRYKVDHARAAAFVAAYEAASVRMRASPHCLGYELLISGEEEFRKRDQMRPAPRLPRFVVAARRALASTSPGTATDCARAIRRGPRACSILPFAGFAAREHLRGGRCRPGASTRHHMPNRGRDAPRKTHISARPTRGYRRSCTGESHRRASRNGSRLVAVPR
jgi:hypothetical protein